MNTETVKTAICSFKIQATVMFILAIVFVVLWYNMIRASYADDQHECKSKLWARYTGFWLLFGAVISLITSAYYVYVIVKTC